MLKRISKIVFKPLSKCTDIVGFAALTLILPCWSQAQGPWRSSLYPENWTPPNDLGSPPSFQDGSFLQDYSYAGYRKGEGQIPDVVGPVINAVADHGADPSGTYDSTSAIQSAIDYAEGLGGGVVYLPEGTYRLSVPVNADSCLLIESSNIVLRGAGVGKTLLRNETTNMRHRGIVKVKTPSSGDWFDQGYSSVLVSDALGPTRTLHLQDTSAFNVGDYVIVHNPPTDDFILDLNMGPGDDNTSWVGNHRIPGIRILRQILSVDSTAKTIELDIPTRWFFKTRDGALVYKKVADHISEVGLEDFSIGNFSVPGGTFGEGDYDTPGTSAYHAHGSYAIGLEGVVDGWVRRISSYNPGNENGVHIVSNGLVVNFSKNLTLQNLDFQKAQYGGGGGNGYMIRLDEANECLVVDSEVGHCRHGIVMWGMENSGNVITRCYDHNSGIHLTDGTVETVSGRGSDSHGFFSHSNLFDNIWLEKSYLEAAYRGDWGGVYPHGMTSGQSLFWNNGGSAYHDKANYIVHSQQLGEGYVIGTRGTANSVNTSERRPNSATKTDPVDFVEGVGSGDVLYPRSIYTDQLAKRIGKRVEAEDGILNGVSTASAAPGYSGSGYVWANSLNDDNDSVTVYLNVDVAGPKDLRIGYRNSNRHREQSLFINGEKQEGVMENGRVVFPPDATSSWRVITVENIQFQAGVNEVRLEKYYGWVDIDYFEIDDLGLFPPSSPPHLIANSVTSEAVDLSWNDVDNEVAYQVEVLGGGHDKYVQAALLLEDSTSCTISGLDPNTQYSFRVRSYNDGGYSSPSNTVVATTASLDAMHVVSGPSNVLGGSTVPVTVSYSASTALDIIIKLENIDQSYAVEGLKRITVGAGSGYLTEEVAVNSDAPDGANYHWQAVLAPVGQGWYERLDVRYQSGVSVAATSDPLVLYDDELADGWSDGSWGGVYSSGSIGKVYFGEHSYEVIYDGSNSAFNIRADSAVDASGYSEVTFRMYASGSVPVPIVLHTLAQDDGGFSLGARRTIQGGRWNHITVPFSELGNPIQIKRVKITNDSGVAQSALYLDGLLID